MNRIILAPLIFLLILATGCTKAQLLSAEPSALDLDESGPTCPGLTDVTVGSGPSLALTWAEGSDDLSQTSAITYQIFIRSGANSYDLVSPSKIVVGATTTILSSGIQLGQTYTLFVSCKDQANNVFPKGPINERVVTVSDASPPTAISDLTVTNPNYTTVLLTWSPADDGVGGTSSSQMKYKLYTSTSTPVVTTGSPYATLTGATSYTQTGLVPGTTYYYKIVSEDIGGNRSSDSNQASGATLTDTTLPLLSPNLRLNGSPSTVSIPIQWNSGSDDVTPVTDLKYKVYRCAGATTCDPYALAPVFTTSANVQTYTDTGLASNTIYVYGVRTFDSSSNTSTNSDRLILSTSYDSSGTFSFYPTTQEMGIRMGQAVAVANVIGATTAAGGFPDLIVGAPNGSEPGATWSLTGCIYIFAGTAVGVFATTPSQYICQPSPLANGNNNRNFGYAIATGDLDGNGTADLVVSSPQQDRIFIYRSSLSGTTLSIGASSSVISNGVLTAFGFGVCLGNSDGVGADDIFVVNPLATCTDGCGLAGTSTVSIYANTSSAGSFSLPSLAATLSPSLSLTSAPNSYSIAAAEQTARSCVVGKFDPNATSQDILIVGSGAVDHDNNTTANDGLLSFFRRTGANTFAYQNSVLAINVNPPAMRDTQWGDSLAMVNTDATGAPELFVGAPVDSSVGASAGAVYGYAVTTTSSVFSLSDLGNYYYGGSDLANNGAGSGIAAGSIWGHSDAKQDLVVGSPLDDRTTIVSANAIDFGDVFTYKNTSGVIGPAIQQQQFDVSGVNARINNEFGRGLCKGDVNNDTIEDIIVGAPGQSYDPNSLVYSGQQGAVYVYYGVTSGEIDFANPSQILFSPGNQATGYFGYSCAVLDYNGDDKFDLLVGSPYRDVGANADRGAVFVYYGSSAGSSLPLVNSATLLPPVLEASVFFGYAMTVGDLDANGIDDLIVSSPLYDASGVDNGAAWVFWANDTTGAIMASTNVSTIVMPRGAQGSTTNPSLFNASVTGLSGTVTSAVRATNVVTVTTPVAHGLAVSNVVSLHGVIGASAFSGNVTVTAVPTATTFRYASTGVNETASLLYPMWNSASQASTNFGYSVATFPTKTGSMALDLIVCAPSYDAAVSEIDSSVAALANMGVCYIYEGKTNAGLSGSYTMSLTARNDIRYPFGLTAYAAATQNFGSGMTTGDWDNDGVNDLVICAYRARNLQISVNNTGGCFAYLGRADGGVQSSVGWRTNAGSRQSLLANSSYYSTNTETGLADFGHAVLLTDVNNNLRADLLVGQPLTDNLGGPSNLGYNSGNVFVIRGGY